MACVVIVVVVEIFTTDGITFSAKSAKDSGIPCEFETKGKLKINMNVKRNFLNFFGILNHIKKNYKKIQKDLMRNKLPTNKEFIEEFVKAIDAYKEERWPSG